MSLQLKDHNRIESSANENIIQQEVQQLQPISISSQIDTKVIAATPIPKEFESVSDPSSSEFEVLQNEASSSELPSPPPPAEQVKAEEKSAEKSLFSRIQSIKDSALFPSLIFGICLNSVFLNSCQYFRIRILTTIICTVLLNITLLLFNFRTQIKEKITSIKVQKLSETNKLAVIIIQSVFLILFFIAFITSNNRDGSNSYYLTNHISSLQAQIFNQQNVIHNLSNEIIQLRETMIRESYMIRTEQQQAFNSIFQQIEGQQHSFNNLVSQLKQQQLQQQQYQRSQQHQQEQQTQQTQQKHSQQQSQQKENQESQKQQKQPQQQQQSDQNLNQKQYYYYAQQPSRGAIVDRVNLKVKQI